MKDKFRDMIDHIIAGDNEKALEAFKEGNTAKASEIVENISSGHRNTSLLSPGKAPRAGERFYIRGGRREDNAPAPARKVDPVGRDAEEYATRRQEKAVRDANPLASDGVGEEKFSDLIHRGHELVASGWEFDDEGKVYDENGDVTYTFDPQEFEALVRGLDMNDPNIQNIAVGYAWEVNSDMREPFVFGVDNTHPSDARRRGDYNTADGVPFP